MSGRLTNNGLNFMSMLSPLRTLGLLALATFALTACMPDEPETTKLYAQPSKTFKGFYFEGYAYKFDFFYKDIRATHKQVITFPGNDATKDLTTDQFLEMTEALDREAYQLARESCPPGAPRVGESKIYEEVSSDKQATILYACT